MRLRMIWAVWVSILALYSCKGDEGRLRDQSELLCIMGVLDSPNLDTLPDSFEIAKHIRAEDVAFLRKKKTFDDSANAVVSGYVSMAKVLTEARKKRTKCEIESVQMRGSSATVRLHGTAPRVEDDVISVIKEVGSAQTSDEKIKKADAFLAKGRLITTKYEINFVKTNDGWLADLQLPENAAKEQAAAERNKKIEKAKNEVLEFIQWYEWDEAKAKVQQVEKIISGDPDVIAMSKKIDDALKSRIAGKWFEQKYAEAKTDTQDVYVKLLATRGVSSGYFREIPTLVARCVAGELELLVVINEVIDRSIWGTAEVGTAKADAPKAGAAKAGTAKAGAAKTGPAKVDAGKVEPAKIQYHFGEEPPEPIAMNPSIDHQTLFFPDAKKWMERLVKKASDSLVIHIPLLDETPKAVSFNLEGADKAIGKVLAACSTTK